MLENKYLFLAILGIMGVVAVSGCTSQTTTSANTVTIQNMAFNPATLNVQVGTTVTWTNKDSATHRVVSDTGLFNSGDLTTGMSYNYTFNQTGSFSYHCSIHPSMTGTVVVSTNDPSNSNTSTNTNSGGSGPKY
ncbi:MAG: cupredoxin family copper-binding protein [Methanobacterium sp.]|uniref:cupredoxin domain-containing protein n=1 Tax=Methanobacterium sp. TaxID=2164 RepID=UPI003D646028|nr:cupredoxin family copper-binding protein [Methanobacterium sp.]